jgi:hypothetical protein
MNYICCLIILKIEYAHEGHLEVIFEECSTNENAIVFSWSLVEGVGHYCCLWRWLNDLPQEQQLFYVVKIRVCLIDRKFQKPDDLLKSSID